MVATKPKAKTTSSRKTPPPPPRKVCGECKKDKMLKDFYITRNKYSSDGHTEICKECLKSHVNYMDMNTVYNILQNLDVPFLFDAWESAKRTKPEDPFVRYITTALSGLGKFKSRCYNDSEFTPKRPMEFAPGVARLELTELKEKWGYGYDDSEIIAFERKYNQLKRNYKEKTAMHIEALMKYVRYSVKEENATASNLIGEAKQWGALAKDAASAAKINPSQMSAADLLDGVSCFGQLAKALEETDDIIPMLPQFMEQPQDKVDFTLWCYINYIRELKGLPRCEYREIYKFYQDMLKDYKNSFDFLDDEMSEEEDEEGSED